MRATMTAIHKEHNDKIFNNLKKIEWRKRPLPKGKNYIYEPKKKDGCGAVVGHIYIYTNIRFLRVSSIPEHMIKLGGVSRDFLKEYAKGKPIYANYIYTWIKFSKPMQLNEFTSYSTCKPIEKAPQSYIYVEEI